MSYRGVFTSQVARKKILFVDHQGDTCLLLHKFCICSYYYFTNSYAIKLMYCVQEHQMDTPSQIVAFCNFNTIG